MGGLSRRAYIISKLRERNEAPVLFVDSGNILFKKKRSSKLHLQDRLAASAIQEMYRAMQYTAVAVGPLDLLDGTDSLLEGLVTGTPWISANLHSHDGNPLFPPWVIHKTGDYRIGIIGLTGQADSPDKTFQVVPWSQVLPAAVKTLAPASDFVILLSSMDDEENRRVVAEYPEINLLISASQKNGNMVPAVHNNTLITQTHTRGKYFGSLYIDWKDVPVWAESVISGEDLKEDLVASAGKYIGSDRHGKIQKRIESIKPLTGDDILKQGGSFRYRFRALSLSVPESPGVKQIIETLKTDISSKNSARISDKTNKLSVQTLSGSTGCIQCHKAQWEFWNATAHARAYKTLEKENQQYNLDCLGCHVTWPREEGGNSDRQHLLSLPENFKSVGCEMCHGSALAHENDNSRTDTFSLISETTCLPCHTREMDSSFDFTEKRKRIACPSS